MRHKLAIAGILASATTAALVLVFVTEWRDPETVW
jgi:hypothetical protein